MSHRTSTETNPAAGARPEEPLCTTRQPLGTTKCQTGSPTQQVQVSPRGNHHPTLNRAKAALHSLSNSPARPPACATHAPPGTGPTPAKTQTPALARTTVLVGASRHEPQTPPPHQQWPKLAQTRAGLRHRAPAVGLAATSGAGKTRAAAGITDSTRPRPRRPSADKEVREEDSMDTLPASQTGPRRRDSGKTPKPDLW